MDLNTKKATDREYVDRFFHGVASKLMMHPYFTKYAKENDMSKGIAPVSAEHLEKVMLAVKEARKSAVENLESSNQRQTAISSEYTQNMEHVRKLLVLQSKLLEALKKCKKNPRINDINVAIQDVDAMIKNAYATGVVEVDTGVKTIAAYEEMLNEINECKYNHTMPVAYHQGTTSINQNGQSHTYANAPTPAQTPAQTPAPV